MTEWHKYPDIKPNQYEKKLCYSIKDDQYNIGYLDGEEWFDKHVYKFHVDKWCDIPEPPKPRSELFERAFEFRLKYGGWPPNQPINELNYKEYVIRNTEHD